MDFMQQLQKLFNLTVNKQLKFPKIFYQENKNIFLVQQGRNFAENMPNVIRIELKGSYRNQQNERKTYDFITFINLKRQCIEDYLWINRMINKNPLFPENLLYNKIQEVLIKYL